MTDDKKVEHAIAAWKQTVDVQKHFNDIALKVRNLAVTLLVAVVGAVAVAHEKAPDTHLATVVAAAGLVGWALFYVMDEWWYHRLLKGAVKHGTTLENYLCEKIGDNLFELTISISAASPVTVFKGARDEKELHAHHRIRIFYGGGAVLLVLLAVGLMALPSQASVNEARGRQAAQVVADSLTPPGDTTAGEH